MPALIGMRDYGRLPPQLDDELFDQLGQAVHDLLIGHPARDAPDRLRACSMQGRLKFPGAGLGVGLSRRKAGLVGVAHASRGSVREVDQGQPAQVREARAQAKGLIILMRRDHCDSQVDPLRLSDLHEDRLRAHAETSAITSDASPAPS